MLTDEGTLRMQKLGENLRVWHKNLKSRGLVDAAEPAFLALSSGVQRCKDSLMSFLGGLYGIEGDIVHNSPTSPEPYDTKLVPALDYNFVYKAYPNIIHHDALTDANISSMFGVKRLMQVLKQRYSISKLDESALNLFSTIRGEMIFDKSLNLSEYSKHFEWVNEVLTKDYKTGNVITLFDVFNRVTLLGYLSELQGNAGYLTSAPIITSLLESMQVEVNKDDGKPLTSWRQNAYKNRNLIVYSSHDTVISNVLKDMGILAVDTAQPFEKRLLELKNANASEVDLYLSGMTMPHFGVSARFSLWNADSDSNSNSDSQDNKSNWLVRLDLYNEPDWSNSVKYRQVKLGNVCLEQYAILFGSDSLDLLDLSGVANIQYDCPFEVFEKIYSHWIIDNEKMSRAYNNKS